MGGEGGRVEKERKERERMEGGREADRESETEK